MRLRLLRRRLTISAPRVAIRSAMPWPVRWLLLAVVFGLCAAVALWAFEFGKSIAGLDSGAREELVRLRGEVARLVEETQRQHAVSQTAESILTADRATLQTLMAQVRQLEGENRTLREDLGFFERLIPGGSAEGVAIRGLHAEIVGGMQLRWQVLVIQAARNAPEFNGKLELVLAGTQDGKPWTQTFPHNAALQLRQYRRLEGMLTLPPDAVVKTVTARVLDGSNLRTSQTMALAAE
ncbi:MAG: DUF6776 family protein [Pseudomonadota bacterium]